MAPKNNSNSNSTAFPCSLPTIFLTICFLCTLTLSLFLLLNKPSTTLSSIQTLSTIPQTLTPSNCINVFVADLPRSLNYGLLQTYWTLPPDSRIPHDPDHDSTRNHQTLEFPPYPENPLIKQYSAEYWVLGDLMTPKEMRGGSFAKRVFDEREADVVFVPFFSTLSAEMQLSVDRGVFRKKVGNEDYKRQKEVVEFVKKSEAWKRSGGRDHVFILTG